MGGQSTGDRGYTYCLNEMPQRNAFGGVIRCYNRIKIGEISCMECQVRRSIENVSGMSEGSAQSITVASVPDEAPRSGGS